MQLAIDKVLKDVHHTILEATSLQLEVPFSLDELHRSTRSLAKNKVPGPNGVPIEFYIKFWELIRPKLLNILNKGHTGW